MIDVHGFNLRHLRGLAALADCGSVSLAAATVHISQPALTQGLARLAEQTGVVLHLRRPGGAVLTSAGAVLAGRVREALRHLEAVEGGGRAVRFATASHLRALVALADGGRLTAAADAAGVAVATIHRSVRELERLTGIALTERRGRGIGLTAAGLAAARACRLATTTLHIGLAEIGAEGAQGARIVRVGAMPLARVRLLPAATARFVAEWPEIAVTIVEGGYDDLVAQLRDGRLDLIVGALRDPAPDDGVEGAYLFADTVGVFGGAGHPLAGTRPDAAALAGECWIAGRPGTRVRHLWEALFADAGIAPRHAAVECGSATTIVELLCAGRFLALLSPHQVWREVAAGRLAKVADMPEDGATRAIGVTRRADWRPASWQQAFVDLLVAGSASL